MRRPAEAEPNIIGLARRGRLLRVGGDGPANERRAKINAEAARLEGSKVFAKDFFTQRAIPTAAYTVVEDAFQARLALGRFGFPVVLKADGLAAGKGVVVATSGRS